MSISLCMIVKNEQDNLNKRQRNISILKKELELNPGYGFALFNLGNEYFACGNYHKAIENYEQSYTKFDPGQGYSSKLVLKMVNCYINMGKHDKGLKLVEEGLGFYPEFTELEYFRALMFFNQLKYTLALKHFEKCTLMGESPLYLNMVEGAGTFRANYLLGEIYFRLEDYNTAVKYYKVSISQCKDFIPSLIKLYTALCRDRIGNRELGKSIDELHKCCGLKIEKPLFDVLIQEKYYELAYKYISVVEKKSGSNPDLSYYKSICRLMLRKYKEACTIICTVKSDKEYGVRAVCLQALCEALRGNTTQAGNLIMGCSSDTEDKLLKVYKAFLSVLDGIDGVILSDDPTESVIFTAVIFDLLKILITLHEFAIFEKALNMLNMVSDKTVLLKLAKLYYNEGCYELAYQELFRSIKIYEVMDFEGAEILCKLKARGL